MKNGFQWPLKPIIFQPLDHHHLSKNLFASVAVAQEACVLVSLSAKMGTQVFDGVVHFLKYELMLGTSTGTFFLCSLLFIWLSNACLPILLNANDHWQKQQKTLFGYFNSFTQDENCGLMVVSSHHSWLKTQDITEYFCIVLLNLKDIKNTPTNSHWSWNMRESILRQPNDS